MQQLYGIWCKDKNEGRGGWMSDVRHVRNVVAFFSLRAARFAAAKEYGFRTYAEAKKNDWCEVRPITDADRSGG